jgi:hypothetical protein
MLDCERAANVPEIEHSPAPVPMSLGAAAAAVIFAWIALPLAAGAWRTCTHDA